MIYSFLDKFSETFKIPKRDRTIQLKILERSIGKSNGKELPGKKFSKICVKGNWRSILQWKFLEIMAGILCRMESAFCPYLFCFSFSQLKSIKIVNVILKVA